MEKLEITDTLLEQLIGEVAPHVVQATGWDLRLDGLSSRALPKERAYEEILLGRLRAYGVHPDSSTPRIFIERALEYIFEGSVLGAYQPGDEEILVVSENVDESNLDGLRVVLGHELVHRGQHVQYPELFAQVEDRLRTVVAPAILAPETVDLQQVLNAVEAIKPVMTLFESHAAYVQGYLAQVVYPRAKIEEHRTLPVLLMRLIGGQKVSQYQEGLPAIVSAAQSGSIDQLYRDARS